MWLLALPDATGAAGGAAAQPRSTHYGGAALPHRRAPAALVPAVVPRARGRALQGRPPALVAPTAVVAATTTAAAAAAATAAREGKGLLRLKWRWRRREGALP